MNSTRSTRLKRLLSFEEKQLLATKRELQKVQAELRRQTEEMKNMQDRFENTIAKIDQTSLEQLRQSGPWSERMQDSIAHKKAEIAQKSIVRDELINRVIEQRASVKGWELLIEKLATEEAEAFERDERIAADDHHLQKQNRRIG